MQINSVISFSAHKLCRRVIHVDWMMRVLWYAGMRIYTIWYQANEHTSSGPSYGNISNAVYIRLIWKYNKEQLIPRLHATYLLRESRRDLLASRLQVLSVVSIVADDWYLKHNMATLAYKKECIIVTHCKSWKHFRTISKIKLKF